MRRLLVLFAIGALALGLSAASALAVPRTMLLENFTNVSCGPCATNNPVVQAFMNKYGTGLVLNVQPHVNWPSASDPFYLLTSSEVTGRRTYYGVNAVPWNIADGTRIGTSSLATLEAAAADRLLLDAPFMVSVSHAVVGSQVNVTASVKSMGTVPAGPLCLHVALVETEIHYASPPGSNGEKDFYNSMRRMLPDQNGTDLVIAPGDERVFNFSTPVVGAWTTANIRAIAWVQNKTTKEVFQAATSAPKPAYAFYYGARELADAVPMETTRSFSSVLYNAGASQDTYTLHVTESLPAGWSASVCVGTTCYPPGTTDIPVHLGAGVQADVLVDVTPSGTNGSGTVTIAATSAGLPTKTWSRAFRVFSGLPILVVDNDGPRGFEWWYAAALDSIHRSYGVWDRTAYGALETEQLEQFKVVIWNADLGYPPVTPADMTALAAYLDHGGRLFMSGQDVGWSLCDPASSDYTPASLAWYQQYLGADYVTDNASIINLTGVAGDPITDGLSFAIAGGTGSSLQDYPDEIQPRAGAQAILTYALGREAGVRYQSGNFKVVYLGYGFAAQSTLASRTTLMDRALTWLDIDLVDAPGVRPNAGRPLAARAAPNPFGPSTKITFAVPGSGLVPVTVTVYDVLGRRVKTLWSAPTAPGERTLTWDGREDSGAPARSGVYLARVQAGAEQRSLKLFLAR